MYVILKWNQAGGEPQIADDTIHCGFHYALSVADDLRRAAHPRRDRFTVHEVDDEPVEG